jgi:hypothetical protein
LKFQQECWVESFMVLIFGRLCLKLLKMPL